MISNFLQSLELQRQKYNLVFKIHQVHQVYKVYKVCRVWGVAVIINFMPKNVNNLHFFVEKMQQIRKHLSVSL